MVNWTETQLARLKELNAGELELEQVFDDNAGRDQAFQRLERSLARHAREQLQALRDGARRPGLCRLESALVAALVDAGFVQVATPTIMSRGLLARMSITDDHPLASQIYWLGDDKCLRPMLAPHLYFLLKDLLRLWDRPIRIFEVGSCFRKESQGSQHSSEFTMLNLVEMGLPMETRYQRLQELAQLVMKTAGIEDFRLTGTSSEVYGETIDVVSGADDLEFGSAAMGPHPLDGAWRIAETWIGIGFGLERLLMAALDSRSLGRLGRSLAYLDGVRLNV